jgi:hypothetical protein
MGNEKITTHAFHIADAMAYGVDKAVLLYNIRHWLEKNKANGTNARDGYYWTYNSAKAFAELFPYMPIRSITDRLNALEAAGVLKSSQAFNRTAFDKTKWYTIPAEYSISEVCQSKGEIRPSTGVEHLSTGTDRPTIPDINTDVTTDINTLCGFDDFWNVWPKHKRKVGRPQCMALWRSGKLYECHTDVIAGLTAWTVSKDWTKDGGEYIPMPAKWLRNEMWKSADAIKTTAGKPIDKMNLGF